ncbi:MAG: hypothetical protein ACLUFH_02090 [Monoglobales bacterium]
MIKKEKIEIPKYIDTRRMVSLKSMGNIKQITISDRLNTGATIKPISKDEFIVVSTGELKQITHHARDRTENVRNLEKTMRNLRDLINTNVTLENITKVRFITLTYRENMRDSKRLYTDFRDFNKRFKRYVKKDGISYEYIICVEAQGRGAFHLHMIAIFSKTPPFIENKVLADIWQHGFVNIRSLNGNIDNIGAYLTAYLSDVDIESGVPLTADLLNGRLKEVLDENGEIKHIIKGGRLKLLPVGMNIYRTSRGIKKPQVEKMCYSDAQKEIEDMGYKKVHQVAVKITDIERDFSSTYINQIYKKQINPDFWRDGSHNKNNTNKTSYKK